MNKEKLYSENKEFDKKIGYEMKKLREKQGYRQIDIAKKLGKSHNNISDYENGRTQFTLGIFMDYCEAIGVDYIQVWNEFHYKQRYRNRKE